MGVKRLQCRTCRVELTARRRKGYCSRACWHASAAYRRMIRERAMKPQHWAANRREQKFAVLIRQYGFWITPELLRLCQDAWTLGRQAKWAQDARDKAAA